MGLLTEAPMPQPTERSVGMIQITNWLEKCSRWPLLFIVVLLTVVLVTAGINASLNMVDVGNSLRELLSLPVQFV